MNAMGPTKPQANLMLLVLCTLTTLLARASVSLLCLSGNCPGQGTLTIGFEGPPYPGGPQPQPPGTYSFMNQYSESGMLFTVPNHPDSLLLIGSGISPDDGTAHLGTYVNTTVVATFPSGAAFSLVSMDAAELSLAGTFQVVGYREDGTSVTNNFIPWQLEVFQTFTFGPGFDNLGRVEIAGGYDLDNVVVNVPEPSPSGLILLGTLCCLGWRWASGTRLSSR